MNTIKIANKGNTKMVAHRGVSSIERENTSAAFIAAGNRSYYGIETDLHRTADGAMVTIHDGRTGRVSPVDLSVEDSRLADLRKINLFDTHGLFTRGDLVIPTLAEYAAICNDYEKVSVLELKSKFSREDIAEILTILQAREQLSHTIFIAFDIQNLYLIREFLPNHPVQFLTDLLTADLLEHLVQHRMDLDVKHTALTKEWVDRFHEAGIRVNCWTVDDPDRCRTLIDWGVDYITSNCLE